MSDQFPAAAYTPRPLPLVIGITGHRDLRPEDYASLAQQVRGIFTSLQARYPATPLILLSPLAEGADRLAARVALELGVRLIVPLPMPQAEYEQDFKTSDSRADFTALLQQAERSFELSLVEGDDDKSYPEGSDARNRQYALVGAYVARHSQILIALWDGVDAKKVGGTSEVVRFKLEGFPEPYGPPRSPLDPVESGPVYHILTPRLSNPTPAGKAFALTELFPKGYENDAAARAAFDKVYQRMGVFNRDAQRLAPRLAHRWSVSRAYVLPEEQAEALPPALKSALSRYASADVMAGHFQKLTLWTLRGLLILALVAASCYEVYSRLLPRPWALALIYLAALFIAYAWYWWARLSDFHNKYLDYRALAEGFRVHLFWRMAGLKDSVADHYLRKQQGELDWIRQAIRIWNIPTSMEAPHGSPSPTAKQSERLQLVMERWVKDQATFFRRTARREHGRSRNIRRLGYGFILVGLALAVIKVFLETAHPLLVGMALTLVVAALLHYYAKTLGLSEHAKQYARMSMIYARAEEQLQAWLAAGQHAEAQALLKELGKEALAENGDWVLLHRDRQLEVSHGK